jgi:hypothetical protein
MTEKKGWVVDNHIAFSVVNNRSYEDVFCSYCVSMIHVRLKSSGFKFSFVDVARPEVLLVTLTK